MQKILQKELIEKIGEFENPSRKALSSRFPFFLKPIIFVRIFFRKLQNFCDFKICNQKSDSFFGCVIARHQSVLRRSLGDSDPKLQERKIINLARAVQELNGVVIPPQKVFSLWETIGRPTKKRAYVDGMLLSKGRVVEGLGGGLCQMSNFLFWIFLHAPIEIVERQHHSLDVFPDSGRVLPFGSGATILYNFVDLKIKNISKHPLQIKIWMNDKYLKGQILSSHRVDSKFHIFEKNHFFVKKGNKYFRHNEIWREQKVAGKKIKMEKLFTNFSPTIYKITPKYLRRNKFKVLDFTKLI